MKKHNLKCSKCGKKADKFGHLLEGVEGPLEYYHWDCYDPKYNNLINALVEDAHKDYEKP